MDNRDITILKHMLKYCNEIEKTIHRFGDNIEKFKDDNDYKDSLSMKIFQIGELANHLTDEYLEKTKNQLNWNAIRGMRNRFAHGYGKMDSTKIFYTAIEDIPVIKKFIEQELLDKDK